MWCEEFGKAEIVSLQCAFRAVKKRGNHKQNSLESGKGLTCNEVFMQWQVGSKHHADDNDTPIASHQKGNLAFIPWQPSGLTFLIKQNHTKPINMKLSSPSISFYHLRSKFEKLGTRSQVNSCCTKSAASTEQLRFCKCPCVSKLSVGASMKAGVLRIPWVKFFHYLWAIYVFPRGSGQNFATSGGSKGSTANSTGCAAGPSMASKSFCRMPRSLISCIQMIPNHQRVGVPIKSQ